MLDRRSKMRKRGHRRAQRAIESSRHDKFVAGKMMVEPGKRESGGVRFSVSSRSLMPPQQAFAHYVRRKLRLATKLPTPPPGRVYDASGKLIALMHIKIAPEGTTVTRKKATSQDRRRYGRIVVN